MAEWMSIREAANLLEISASTVLRSLTNKVRRDREWGAEGEGWRIKPLSERGDYQLRRSWVEQKAGKPSAVPGEATKPEPSPVVAGIVTSKRGVLVGRRHDGKPPWTFIAGEIEPGESPADAAIREVKEETGLLVRAAEREIGRRVHPKTGRTMIYLACQPTGKLDVFVGDEDELAEVRWATLAEAEELLPGMFEPVLTHLRRELSG